MKGIMQFIIFLTICSILVACSSSNTDQKAVEMYNSDQSTEMSKASLDMDESVQKMDDFTEIERKIIHHGNIDISVKGVEKNQILFENKVKDLSGYIVNSTLYDYEQEEKQVSMTMRIPEKSFQTFLQFIEDNAVKVLERNVSSEDVTGEYVDLESRLKSKKVVEKRLLAFMEEAKKTEDLLQISTELADVQEEIEVLTGQMKYIENQSAYATVELNLRENDVSIPPIGETELNTWEKIKKQLATSMNGILFVGSSLLVFIVGNTPILLLIMLVIVPIYIVVRRKWGKK